MSANAFIGKVVVVGGGITAWTAAAALKKRLPSLDVELVETPAAFDALADRIISTLPSSGRFHSDIGLTEMDVISGAASGLRLGTKFKGWADGQADYVHAYGSCGAPVRGIPFHQLWLRESVTRALPPFDTFSPAAQSARHGNDTSLRSYPVGLQLTLSRYGEMMRAYALHLGVELRKDVIADLELRSDSGFIDALVLGSGGRLAGDLFVDCSGATSLLQQRLNPVFVDWSHWLPCDRILFQETDRDPGAVIMDEVVALASGWRWSASSPNKGSTGVVYSSSHVSTTGAEADQAQAGEAIDLHQGRKRNFWVRNCVAIGDSAVTVEPLEWTNLHLVHSQVDRLIAMMPGRDCAEVEVAQFNRECTAEADRVRDFLCLHYICSARPEPFWRDASLITPPASLEHTLSLFGERGRLPYYQEETFTRDSWLTVLLGQGQRPRRIDPLADLVSEGEAEQAFAAMRRALRSYTLPEATELSGLNPHGMR